MAKKRGTQTKTAEMIIPEKNGGELVSTNIQIDKDDVLTVAMAEAEQHLRDHIAERQQQIKDAEELIADSTKAFQAGCTALEEPASAEFRAAMDEMAGKFKSKTFCTHQSQAGHHKAEKPKVRRTLTVTCRVQFAGCSRADNPPPCVVGTVEMIFTTEIPTDVLQHRDTAVATAEQKHRLESEIIELRKQLSNMPQLERQYRAKLARHRLEQSPQGQDVLRTMLDTVHDDVLKISVR